MSAPREIYLTEREAINKQGATVGHPEITYILKSDYDALQAKLTEAERLNKVALEAMKPSDKYQEMGERYD